MTLRRPFEPGAATDPVQAVRTQPRADARQQPRLPDRAHSRSDGRPGQRRGQRKRPLIAAERAQRAANEAADVPPLAPSERLRMREQLQQVEVGQVWQVSWDAPVVRHQQYVVARAACRGGQRGLGVALPDPLAGPPPCPRRERSRSRSSTTTATRCCRSTTSGRHPAGCTTLTVGATLSACPPPVLATR